MSDGKITMLLQALPGLRLLEGGKTEDGSIIALRKEGDECLYVPRTEEDKGMEWIPVGQFSVDPEMVDPIGDEPPGEGDVVDEGETSSEEPAPRLTDPFGGRKLKRRGTSGG